LKTTRISDAPATGTASSRANSSSRARFAFVPSEVMGINLITDGPNYDVQIDEVTFFKNTPPIGPVGP
jgi:hypothetical protein